MADPHKQADGDDPNMMAFRAIQKITESVDTQTAEEPESMHPEGCARAAKPDKTE